MATIERAAEARLRAFFKRYLNRFMLLTWRLGLGAWLSPWPDVTGRIMVLTTVGRRSGRLRRTPLNYALVDGDIYCVAGFGGASDWYRNLRAAPGVEVWLPEGWWAGVAADVGDSPRRLELLRAVLRGSGFAARLAGIDPRAIDDQALAALTADYRLVRVSRTAERTGDGGPGDLAWLWPAAVHLLAVVALARRRRRG